MQLASTAIFCNNDIICIFHGLLIYLKIHLGDCQVIWMHGYYMKIKQVTFEVKSGWHMNSIKLELAKYYKDSEMTALIFEGGRNSK